MQMQQDIFSKTIWNICTVASATIRTGPVLMGRFRLFLGQCGNDSTEHVISEHADYILRAEYLQYCTVYTGTIFWTFFNKTNFSFPLLYCTMYCTVYKHGLMFLQFGRGGGKQHYISYYILPKMYCHSCLYYASNYSIYFTFPAICDSTLDIIT